jgi:general secretion pathway protein F
MPEFQYIAKEMSGREVKGVLSAGNEQEAINSLSLKSLFPTRIALAEGEVRQQAAVGKRVRARHIAIIYSQLGDLLASGVPLLRSLEILEQQSSKPAVTGVLQDVRQQVADGTRLAKRVAFSKRPSSAWPSSPSMPKTSRTASSGPWPIPCS